MIVIPLGGAQSEYLPRLTLRQQILACDSSEVWACCAWPSAAASRSPSDLCSVLAFHRLLQNSPGACRAALWDERWIGGLGLLLDLGVLVELELVPVEVAEHHEPAPGHLPDLVDVDVTVFEVFDGGIDVRRVERPHLVGTDA